MQAQKTAEKADPDTLQEAGLMPSFEELQNFYSERQPEPVFLCDLHRVQEEQQGREA